MRRRFGFSDDDLAANGTIVDAGGPGFPFRILVTNTLDGPAPGVELALSAGVGVALLAVGLLYFQHAERNFADVI